MPNEKSFDQAEYLRQYKKDRYYEFKVTMPKEKKTVLEALSETTHKSINRLFIEAVEQKYNVDLTNIEKQWKKEVKVITKRLENLTSSEIESDDVFSMLAQSINELYLIEERAGEYEGIRNPEAYENVTNALSYLNYTIESKGGVDEMKELLKKSVECLKTASKF